MNGNSSVTKGFEAAAGAARQYAMSAGNRGGIVAVFLHADIFRPDLQLAMLNLVPLQWSCS